MKKTYIIPEIVVSELDLQQGFLTLSAADGIDIEAATAVPDESLTREDKSYWGDKNW